MGHTTDVAFEIVTQDADGGVKYTTFQADVSTSATTIVIAGLGPNTIMSSITGNTLVGGVALSAAKSDAGPSLTDSPILYIR